MIRVVNTYTGEIEEFPHSSPEDIVESWKQISNQIKALERAKDKLKQFVPNILDNNDTYENNGYRFRMSTIQRYNYDKSIMRQVFDEDLLDTLLKPDKTLIDNYIKDNLETLTEGSTLLRNSMVEDGKPYQVIKLEKVSRDD